MAKYLDEKAISNEQSIANWEGYIVNLSILYRYRKIEEDKFALQWLCEFFNANIHFEHRTINNRSKILFKI